MTKKVSDLNEATELIASDLLLVVDTAGAVDETKKMTAENAAGAFGSYQVGRRIFKWNGTDISQFEATAVPYDKLAGPLDSGDADSTLALSVFDRSADRLGNVLRLTATAMDGGGIFGVLASELPSPMPDRYMVEIVLLDGSIGSLRFGAHLCYDPVASALNALQLLRAVTTSVLAYATVRDNIQRVDGAITGSGTFTATVLARKGGFRQLIEVNRQRIADNPARFYSHVEEKNPDDGLSSDGIYEASTGISAGIGAAWDGDDLDRVGIGCVESSGGTTGTCDIKSFAIYAHPDD